MIKVYNQNMQLTAYLENAFSIGYEERSHELWNASFSLPANDPKTAECLPLRFVEIYDGDERVDLFRIVPTKTQRSNDGKTITYTCEHVLATLLDDVLFQYHQIGGADVPTAAVLQYILDRQTTVRWQLGTVAFSRQFEYNFENENLLASLFAVPKPFDQPYRWTWNTTTSPWTLNLIEPETAVSAYIRYGKNLKGITKEEDPTQLATRMFALGYGEGVNQLDIRSVNPTGLPYIDADTQAQYGIISDIFVDRRYEHAETLFAAAKAELEARKHPKLTYTVDGTELYQLTDDPIDKFPEGALVRVIDEELGIDIVARVMVRGRPDVNGDPGAVRLEIANKASDIADSESELRNRQRINEVYAQGATCIDSHDFSDNCDPDHPAVMRFYVPEDTVRINKVLLSYESGKFRAYSKAIQGGGAFAETITSSAGGLYENTATSAAGGVFNNTISSAAGGADITTTGDSGIDVIYSYGQTQAGGADGHQHLFREVIGHKHQVALDDHVHEVDIQIPAHVHNVHISIPAHEHQVSISIPDHIHEIQYGIFEGPEPTAIQLKVDGNTMPITDTNRESIDILPYLAKDSEGRLTRGTWHEIEITPNDLARITANVVIQLFVQSRGGVSA